MVARPSVNATTIADEEPVWRYVAVPAHTICPFDAVMYWYSIGYQSGTNVSYVNKTKEKGVVASTHSVMEMVGNIVKPMFGIVAEAVMLTVYVPTFARMGVPAMLSGLGTTLRNGAFVLNVRVMAVLPRCRYTAAGRVNDQGYSTSAVVTDGKDWDSNGYVNHVPTKPVKLVGAEDRPPFQTIRFGPARFSEWEIAVTDNAVWIITTVDGIHTDVRSLMVNTPTNVGALV